MAWRDWRRRLERLACAGALVALSAAELGAGTGAAITPQGSGRTGLGVGTKVGERTAVAEAWVPGPPPMSGPHENSGQADR